MRAAVVLLQLCCLPVLGMPPMPAVEAPAPPPPPAAAVSVITDAERAAIDRVVAALIAAGAPDTRGASIVVGEVVVSEQAEKGKDVKDGKQAPAPADDDPFFSPFGMANEERPPAGMKTRSYNGVHLVLADGRWLMQLNMPVAPSPQRTITPSAESTRLPPAQLAEHLAKNRGDEDFMREVDEDVDDAWLDLFTPEARTRMVAVAKAGKPLMALGGRWNGGIGMLLLHRAGTTGAAEQLLLSGTDQLYPYYARRNQRVAPLILDHQGGRWGRWDGGGFEDEEAEDANADPEDWRERKKGTLTIPDPTPVLEQEILSWFHSLLANERQRTAFGLSVEQVTRQILAFTPAEQRPEVQAGLDLLLAARALPDKAPAGADLAARLQSWQTGWRMDDEDGGAAVPDETMLAQMPAEVQEHFRKRMGDRNAWRPGEADVPGILELLTDPRPSRWIDGTTAHPLGDNALRALYAVMRVDPRLLVGRNPGKPWTAAERTACAEAIRAWHKGLGGKPLGEGLLAAIGRLPLGGAITLISQRKPDERAPLLERLAAVLPETPGKDITAVNLSRLLAIAGDDATIKAKVSGWPTTGPLRPLLAVWHDQQGRPAELDKLLDDLMAQGDADDQAADRLAMGLQAAMARPSAARLQRCLTLAAGPLPDRRTWAVLSALSGEQDYGDKEWSAVAMLLQEREQRRLNREPDEKADPANAIPLAMLCTFLADRRPLGEKDVTMERRARWCELKLPGMSLSIEPPEPAAAEAGTAAPEQKPPKKPTAPPPPTGLRVSDIAAHIGPRVLYGAGLHELASSDVNLWTAQAERDAAQHTLATALADKARAALTAAKLPDVLPAAASADAQALF